MGKYTKAKFILVVSLFLVMLGFGIIIPILPFYVEKFGGGSLAFGVFMTAYSLMQFIFAPMWGRLSDKIGRRPVLLIGLTGYALTFFLFGAAVNVWMLVGIRALAGMVSSATIPTAMAYLADITDAASRSKNMGMVGAAFGLGMAFGPALGGWAGHFGMAVPFYVAGGIAAAIVPMAIAFLPETLQPAENSEKKRNGWQLGALNLGVLLKDPLLILYSVNFVMNFTLALFESTFSLLVAYKIHYGPDKIGNIFAILGIIAIVVQGGLIGALVKRFGDVNIVKAGIIFCGLGMVLIVKSPIAALIVINTAMFMSGNSLMGPTTSSLVSKSAGETQGESLGNLQSFGSLGRMLGPITGGFLYGYSHNLPYLLGAALLLLILLVGNTALNKFREPQLVLNR